MEKLFEEGLRKQLVEHFETEDLIPEEHHGGREGHSTLTAKTVIDKHLADMVANNEESMNLSTNLSKCYDLIDHKLLTEKLKIHNINDESIELIESFLSERTFQVEIQGFKSGKKKLDNCSVIQGSKGAVFFSLFSA